MNLLEQLKPEHRQTLDGLKFATTKALIFKNLTETRYVFELRLDEVERLMLFLKDIKLYNMNMVNDLFDKSIFEKNDLHLQSEWHKL